MSHFDDINRTFVLTPVGASREPRTGNELIAAVLDISRSLVQLHDTDVLHSGCLLIL
jgi:hypothetical protein